MLEFNLSGIKFQLPNLLSRRRNPDLEFSFKEDEKEIIEMVILEEQAWKEFNKVAAEASQGSVAVVCVRVCVPA